MFSNRNLDHFFERGQGERSRRYAILRCASVCRVSCLADLWPHKPTTTARLGRGSFAFIVQGCREPRLDRCIDLRLFVFQTEIGNPCRTERTPEVEAETTMAGTKKKFIPMSFERYGSFKNCYINKKVANWLKLQNPIVSRYMLYSNFKGAAEKSHLTFVSPDKWVDPFEKIYLNTKLKNFPSNKNL